MMKTLCVSHKENKVGGGNYDSNAILIHFASVLLGVVCQGCCSDASDWLITAADGAMFHAAAAG